jgi:hypothetical protein
VPLGLRLNSRVSLSFTAATLPWLNRLTNARSSGITRAIRKWSLGGHCDGEFVSGQAPLRLTSTGEGTGAVHPGLYVGANLLHMRSKQLYAQNLLQLSSNLPMREPLPPVGPLSPMRRTNY